MKTLLFSATFFASFIAVSCSSTAKDYGKKYCDCVEKHKGQNKECADIMSQARDKFPDGKEEFMSVAKECMNK